MITHEEARKELKHRDNTCPMYHTCSSLGYISENCSIKCYLDTTQQRKKDERAKKVEEMLDIYKRNYQVQMCLNDRLRLIEIEKELEELK